MTTQDAGPEGERHPLEIDTPCPACGARLQRSLGPTAGTFRAPQRWRSREYCVSCGWESGLYDPAAPSEEGGT